MSNARYERRQLLGDGGMGQVWLGVDNELGRAVALKVPLQRLGNDPKFVDRFRREARAMARIKHDNVIDIYDVCDSDHGPFIVMERSS
jgi:eukaryotic-like serine/threonine-protein kinase